MDPIVKAFYHEIPGASSYQDVKTLLKKHHVSPTDLDCARRIAVSEKKNKKKRKSTAKSKAVVDNSFQQIANSISNYKFFNQETAVEIEEEDEDEEVDETDKKKKKKQYLYHNSEVNPEEWTLINEMFYLIGKLLYDDLTIKLFSLFLEQKIYTEPELTRVLGFSPNQFRETMARLERHQLIARNNVEKGASEVVSSWGINLNYFFDSMNYRILAYYNILESDIEKLQKELLQCSNCNKTFTAINIPNLVYEAGQYKCSDCLVLLSEVNNQERIKEKQEVLSYGRKDLLPLVKQFAKLSKHTSAESFEASFKEEKKMKVPLRQGQAVKKKDRKVLLMPNKLTQVASKPGEALAKMEEEVLEPYNARPLKFHRNEIHLPIIEDMKTWEREKGHQMAKVLLDNIAEFRKMWSGNFVYVITPASLFIAYKRGFRSMEMVRLLNALSVQGHIPATLFRLIMDESKYKTYYKVFLTLQDGKYYVQTQELDLLKSLVSKSSFLEYTASSNIMKITTTSDQTSEVLSEYYAVEVSNRSMSLELIKRACFNLGAPIIDEYDFSSPRASPPKINIRLKTAVMRDYQGVSSSKMFWDSFKCHSGVLVLPCGAGKTLIGINIVATIQRPAIIFCQSSLAVLQWGQQLSDWTTLQKRDICLFSSSHTDTWRKDALVIITTYAMFSNTANRQARAKEMMQHIQNREWGVMVLDEVHQAPAQIFRQVTNGFKVHVKLGLTATLVREDEKVADMPYLVGPKLFDLDIFTLKMRGHVAPVECHEILCDTTSMLMEAYNACSDKDKKRLLYITNINKTRVCANLIERHANSKIIIFCDNLFGLNWYHALLKKPKIDGKTPLEERKKILEQFKSGQSNCILFSRVGDQSIDLPEADVVIQIAIIAGSRMQEGQRIGRIQRPHPNKKIAHFYSLISRNTEEVRYARRRREYLIEHGYNVTVYDDCTKFYDQATQLFYEVEPSLIEKINSEMRDRDEKKDDKAKGYTEGRSTQRQKVVKEVAPKKRKSGPSGLLKITTDYLKIKRKKESEGIL